MKSSSFLPQYTLTLGSEEKKHVLDAINNNWISEGPKTKKFEGMVGKFLGARHAATVTSGTLAVTVACKALGIKRGDEVIMPDLTMAGTANGVILAGATPVFADIKEDDLTIDPKEVERKLTKKTKAIITVQFNGRASDLMSLIALSKKGNLKVIEDAAQAFGSKLGSKYLGTFGDIGCFSFSVPKVVTTAQGGMVVTNNKRLYEKILKLKDQGRRERGKDIHDTIGFNFGFSDIQAAIGLAQMKKLKANLKRKKEIYWLYRRFLKDIPQIKFIDTNLEQTIPWFVDIYLEKRDGLVKYLAKNKVGTLKMYPAMHTHKAYKTFISKHQKYPNSTRGSKMGLWLPSSMSLTNVQIRGVCGLIEKYYD